MHLLNTDEHTGTAAPTYTGLESLASEKVRAQLHSGEYCRSKSHTSLAYRWLLCTDHSGEDMDISDVVYGPTVFKDTLWKQATVSFKPV